MAIIKLKPVTPGQRSMARVKDPDLWKGEPYSPLLQAKKRGSGRNNAGRITVRHKGGGHKQAYRVIDFKRKKDGVLAKVERIEYDPNRSANIALVCYRDGERLYILAPKGLVAGMEIMSGPDAPIKAGNALPLRHIPVGTTIHNVELKPGKGGQLARSAGSSVQLLGREGDYAQVRLRSGEMRKVHLSCRATIGEVGNSEHALAQHGKAGASRWRGVRPTVRGEVMNPVDHPHGGRTRGNRHPVSPTAVPAKGYRTRKNKRTQSMIIARRAK